MISLRFLTITGYIEGISYLLLLGIAMPLKYIWDMPQMVSVVGMAHGLLFIFYVVILALVSHRARLPWWSFPLGFIGSVLPFGPFVFDRILVKSSEQKSAA